jgi:hypothetical protein
VARSADTAIQHGIAIGAAARVIALAALTALVPGMDAAQAVDISSGSGVVIGAHGEILTNAHVVENCAQITVRSSSGDSTAATLVARDEKNDLAVVRSQLPSSSVAIFRDRGPVRAGDAVVVLGYPLSGLLATSANLSVGNVSALAGLGDDSRYLQISAPVQPGNSGGPLLDASGHLVGIVAAKLDAALVARFTGDIPQNVNFALKAEVARTFLDSNGIAYQTARSDQSLSPADVGQIARLFTVRIECRSNEQADQRELPKYSDRVPRDQEAVQAPNAGTHGQAALRPRVVLYEEDSNDPLGKRYVGSVIWRTEMVSPGPGLAPELAVRADVIIPERHIAMTWSFRRNTDPALPASHTIEMLFNLPAHFPGGGIANVASILMKRSEQGRGTPLAGLAVKVTKGFFLYGLSAVNTDQQRNIQLLMERPWFDIPIVYTNGGHAILALEKGTPGDRAFYVAFAAWGQ